jgi:hypothetical protein
MPHKIKFSKNMKKQEWHLETKEPKKMFKSKMEALKFGIQKWGSGSFNKKYGWYVKEVK